MDKRSESTIQCRAIPLGGDGSEWCCLAPRHRGLHVDSQGAPFRKIQPGSSPRSSKGARIGAILRARRGEL